MATRRERVVLELEDQFTTPMARAAAAAALLNRELNSLSGNSTKASKAAGPLGNRDIPAIGRSAERAGPQIDRFSGRLRVIADVAAALGPALIPLGGVGIAGLGGLANQFGVAAIAGGSAIIAFQGVGTALEALNKARLEPTVENLAAARTELERLSPAAQDLTEQLFGLRDEWAQLKSVAAEGLLPGVGDALDSLESRIPDVERIVGRMNETLGMLLADAGDNLAGQEWDEFFDFLATDGVDTLDSLGRTVGNLTRGFAELWMAFDPLNDEFSRWALEASRDFAEFADGLSATEGFQEFVDYIRETGPQVAATLGALGNALVDIVQAASPLGGPALQALEALARVISTIADSPIGTPLFALVGAMAALNRVQGTYNALATSGFGVRAQAQIRGTAAALASVTSAQDRARLSAQQLATAQGRRGATLGKSGAGLAGLGILATGAADSIGLTNTASLALIGTLAGPWGAALGGATGFVLDLSSANDDFESSLRNLQALIRSAPADYEGQKAALAGVEERADALTDKTNKLAFAVNSIPFAGPIINRIFGVSQGADQEVQQAQDAADSIEDLADARRSDVAAALFQNDALDKTGAALRTAQQSADGFSQSLLTLNSLLGNRAGLRDYEAALDALRASLAESGSFDAGAEEGRRNLANLDAIAGVAIKRAEQLKEQGKDLAALRVLQRATADVERFAEESPAAERAAQSVLDLLRDLSGARANASINIDASRALTAIQRVAAALRAIPNRTVEIGGRTALASGGPVWGPGTPTSDSIPAWLSNGEFVMRAAAVQKYGLGVMHDMNSMRFAEGGQVPDTRLSPQAFQRSAGPVTNYMMSGGIDAETARLLRDLAARNTAPLMDNVTIRLNDGAEMQRYAQEKSRLRAGGGVDF